MPYSYTKVVAVNGQVNFALTFPYLSRTHVSVFVDAAPVEFSWLNPFLIALKVAVSGTPEVIIRRGTPKDEPLVNFEDGANQTESDLDSSILQLLYIAQETTETSELLSVTDATLAAIAARDQALLAQSAAETAVTEAEAAAEEATQAVEDLIATIVIQETVGSNIASASTINPTGADQLVTGTVRIDGFDATCSSCRLTFQSSLNITHGTALISPHGVDYRTIPGEVLEFRRDGSGNYKFWSLNGPKERPGQSIESWEPTPPPGFLEEDGAAISRTDYSGLYSIIGTTHGVGNGTTTFNKPNSRGRAPINMDAGANVVTSSSVNGANANTMGGKGGAQTHTLSESETPIKAHAHNQQDSFGNPLKIGSSAGGGPIVQGLLIETVFDSPGPGNSSTASQNGSATSHSNTQPWIAKKFYIRY